jgi:hypothetical protein
MNIPPRYSFCVLATAVLAIIGYFVSPLIGLGIVIGGLVSPLFVFVIQQHSKTHPLFLLPNPLHRLSLQQQKQHPLSGTWSRTTIPR